MDAAEWDASSDLMAMLDCLKSQGEETWQDQDWSDWYKDGRCYTPVTRKIRLFGCACARHLWQYLKNWEAQSAVQVTEKVVDGLLTPDRIEEVWSAVRRYAGDYRRRGLGSDWRSAEQRARDDDPLLGPERLACRVAAEESEIWTALRSSMHEYTGSPRAPIFLSFLRDVFGNPYRPTELQPLLLSRFTTTLSPLAKAIYVERSFDRLPILADALEEAGCTDPEILVHCRGPGPHVRGCWVVDFLLGKE